MLAAAGVSGWAIFGAITGGLALLLNVWRHYRERARLRIAFFVQQVDLPDDSGPVAVIEIANVGTLPAYVMGVTVTQAPAWAIRGPLVGRLSFRARRRWPLNRLLRRSRAWYLHAPTDPDLTGRLEPGEAKQGHLVDIINDEPRSMADRKVERLVSERYWAQVTTGLRQYVTRVVDNRYGPHATPPEPL